MASALPFAGAGAQAAAPSGRPAGATVRDQFRRLFRQVGPGRLAITALLMLLGLLVARFAWDVPYLSRAEKVLYDIRAGLNRPRTAQDQRIAMVIYDDDTRIQTGRISPLDRLILAKALRRLDRLGPKTIGIDMLIDQATPEDPALIDAFKSMRTPTFLGFATNATNPEFMPLPREQFLRAFLKQISSGNVHAASIRLLTDGDDGVVRDWPDQPASLPPLLARSMTADTHPAFRSYRGAVRFRRPLYRDDPVFAEVTLQFLADPKIPDEAIRPLVEGRYLLIGGKLDDVDQFKTPATQTSPRPGTTAGLEVHAHMLAQLLDDMRYPAVPAWQLWAAAALVVLAGGFVRLLSARMWMAGALFLLIVAGIVYLPYRLQAAGIDTQGVPVIGWVLGWIIAFAAVGAAMSSVGAKQKKVAQSALAKYLPRDVASAIMRDPDVLSLHGEKREIYALFTDLEGFTKLSHAIEPEMVAILLNRYLDMLSDVVLQHGGTIDKFVGDAVVAFWGAPISRPDDGERASAAAMAMYRAGERFRREAPEGVPPIGCTRVGLHRGEAIVGNFGGEDRIQYTALGDSMNLAARLEGANKQLKTCALVSETAAAGATQMVFRPMGRVAVRGRATPIAVFEPVPDLDIKDVTLLTALVARFDDGDVTALEELDKYCGEHPDDAAVANLVYRLRKIGPGGSFVLD
jgi:adenylate cyclase